MTNQERLEEYLIGEKGYLKNDISNGKVIMLSGKWGSGKTHFWQNKISEDLKVNLKKEEKVYSYISLYGKSSIAEIENDIFGQVYYDAIGGENLVTKTASTFTKLTKRYGGFSSLLDFSKLAEAGEEEQKDNIERTALSRLNNGGIICFDDFERKSKDINLNDLFGFITQLTLNFQCKVVIILNDDVFEGEEKKIFSNVKEKSVSKFLKYEPSTEELFNLIFHGHHISKKYEGIKSNTLKYIHEINILNARIYNQVLDNLLEWLTIYPNSSENERRYLVIGTILFISFHTIFLKDKNGKYFIKGFNDKLENKSNNFNSIKAQSFSLDEPYKEKFKPYEDLNKYFNDFEKSVRQSDQTSHLNNYIIEFKGFYTSKYYANNLKIGDNLSYEQLNKINNFIETGMLIDE